MTNQNHESWEKQAALALLVILAAMLGFFACLMLVTPARGATQWTRTMLASTRYVAASSASADTAGNSYVGVTYAGVVDFGAGPVSAVSNATDAAVVSYDAAGNLRWVSRFTGPEFQAVYGVAAGDDGYVYVTGAYGGTMALANTVTAVGSGDTFIAKIHAASGAHVWVRSYGSIHDESGRAIAYRDGRFCIAGVMYGAHSVGGAALTPQGVDGWVGCYSAAEGSHLWSRTIGGVGADNAMSIALDGAGSAYIGGRYSATLALPPYSLTSAGGADAYLAKLHADGTPLWLASPLTAHLLDDAVTSVSVSNGRVAVTGWTQPGASLPTSIWLAQFTTAGVRESAGEWGSDIAVSSLGSSANGVVATSAGEAMLVGFASAPLNFGGGALEGPYTNDVVTATFNGATYVNSSRAVAAGSQAGMAVANVGSNQLIAANDGNNVSVLLRGDGAPPPTVHTSTSTPTMQATSTRTAVPTWTPIQSPTLTRTVSPKPTNTPASMPTCARPSNAPCLVE